MVIFSKVFNWSLPFLNWELQVLRDFLRGCYFDAVRRSERIARRRHNFEKVEPFASQSRISSARNKIFFYLSLAPQNYSALPFTSFWYLIVQNFDGIGLSEFKAHGVNG